MTGEPVHTTLEERMTPAYGFHLNTQIAKWPLRLFSACHTALQTKNTTRRTSAINPVTMKNFDDSYYKLVYCTVCTHCT